LIAIYKYFIIFREWWNWSKYLRN